MKHKHAVEIIAWADGAEIEGRIPGGEWGVSHHPFWHVDFEYRVKPEQNPDVVRDAPAYPDGSIAPTNAGINSVIRITIDGETGKLSTEVVE